MDIRMSKLITGVGHTYVQADNRGMSKSIVRLDIRMSRLDIRMSKLTTGVGHTYVQGTNIPIGLDIRMSNPCYQLGHTYVQPLLSAWTYLDIRMSKLDIHVSRLDIRVSVPTILVLMNQSRARTLHGPGFDSYGMARSVCMFFGFRC